MAHSKQPAIIMQFITSTSIQQPTTITNTQQSIT
ncbi:hypothetical protein LINPERPRIM_LOCUS14412 [Linum perenne]